MALKVFVVFLAASAFSAYAADISSSCLSAHNEYRAIHSAPALEWDSSLAAGAQQYAEKLARQGSLTHSKGNYGENLYMSWGRDADCQRATKSWYDEIQKYDFNNPGFGFGTGHFTQVVWKSSTKLGVGIATVGRTTAVVARYTPPGNFRGRFRENVLPANGGPGPVTSPPSGCSDNDNRCSHWKSYCRRNKYVKRNCKKTCGRC